MRSHVLVRRWVPNLPAIVISTPHTSFPSPPHNREIILPRRVSASTTTINTVDMPTEPPPLQAQMPELENDLKTQLANTTQELSISQARISELENELKIVEQLKTQQLSASEERVAKLEKKLKEAQTASVKVEQQTKELSMFKGRMSDVEKGLTEVLAAAQANIKIAKEALSASQNLEDKVKNLTSQVSGLSSVLTVEEQRATAATHTVEAENQVASSLIEKIAAQVTEQELSDRNAQGEARILPAEDWLPESQMHERAPRPSTQSEVDRMAWMIGFELPGRQGPNKNSIGENASRAVDAAIARWLRAHLEVEQEQRHEAQQHKREARE